LATPLFTDDVTGALDKAENYTEALTLHQQSLRFRTTHLDMHHPDISQSMNEIAQLYNKLGRHDALASQRDFASPVLLDPSIAAIHASIRVIQ
jgi:hypothetical protein